MISGCPDLAEASPEDTGLDPSFISLLKAVGKKLYELELSQQMYVRDSSAKIEAPPTPTLETVAMDPIEKVEKWQQSDLHLGSPAKEYTGLPSATSCYGSLPPSPTMETSTPCKGPHQHPLTAISPTPHEHDSGYPGSDRSAMRLQLLSLHKQGSTSSSYSGGRKPLILSNVEEERAAASTNNLKNECTSATSRKTTGKRAASMHTTYLNSVTDLSSDERSMFDTKVDDNHLREEKVDGTEEDDEHYPIVPEKYQQTLVALTPGSTSGSRQRQQQPMILATQIDQEIMELRNFFEDHREEMMTLIQENSQELIFPPIDSAITPRRKQRLKARKYEIEQMLSAESGTDFEMERRQEFEKRRRAKKRKDAAAMMINQQQYFHHKQQQQEGLHLQQHHSAIVPDFAIGQQQPNQNQEQQKISAFFPNVDPGLTASGPYSSRHGGGTEVDSAQGPIFIPKLPLDDLWTEKSGDERFCDPRSFDFNQSLASIPSLAQNEEVHPKIAKPGRPKSCERTKSTRTNYGPEIHQQQQSIQVRSQSVADLLHQNPGNSPPNVVIVHSCCRHSSTDRSDRNGSGSSCTNRGRKSSCSNSHHLKEGHKKRGGSSNRKKTKAKMVIYHILSRSRSNNETNKTFFLIYLQEMKALLATLEQANQMAKALRERSQDIVQVLGQEIQTMKET